jgi:glycosyltransferase involved in cell wall biosynthesis
VRGRAFLGVRDDEFVILYYGYIYPGKGIETLLQAMHGLAQDHAASRLVIAGEILEHAFSDTDRPGNTTYKNELHDLARRLGISGQIIWTGPLAPDGDDGSLCMWAADLCVLPFDRGIQLNNSTFAAAASHGLPILTTRGTFLESAFIHGENVWLCPPRDPEAMASALRLLIEEPGRRTALSKGAFALSAEQFSWDRAADRIIALIERAGLNQNGATATGMPETPPR